MQVSDLVDRLERLGFDPEHATVYVKLLQNGPSRASTLASLADLNRTKVYRVLDDLVEDRYASASVGRPTIYRAQEPERVFELLRKDLEARERTLDRVQDDVLEPLESLAGEDHEVSDPDWKLVEGYPRIYETLNRCLRDVEDEIVLVSNDAITTNMVPFVEEAWETAITRAEDGVTFRAMLDLDHVKGDVAENWFEGPNVHVRGIAIDDPLHFVLLDDEFVLQWLVMDPGPSVQMDEGAALLSDARGLLTGARLVTRFLWDQAQPVQGTA
jgi:sugar-specific transcriptional regulator TrmB